MARQRERNERRTRGRFALPDPLPPRIEIVGNGRVLVENHKGVLEYGETVMRISCGKMVIRIEGVGLELDAMSLDAVAVTGKIKSVTYDG